MDCIEMQALGAESQPDNMSPVIARKQKNYYRERHILRNSRLLEKEEIAKENYKKNLNLEGSDINRKDYIKKALYTYRKKKDNEQKKVYRNIPSIQEK